MQPLDGLLPFATFCERHFLDVAESPAALMAAAFAYRPEDDPFFRAAIALREAPMRLGGRLSGACADTRPAFGLDDFTRLEERPGRMLAYGLVGRFWRRDYGLVEIADAEAFRRFDVPGTAKLAVGIWVEGSDDGRTRLVTETRVFCPDSQTRRRFAPYWYLIRPVSGLIRRRILSSIARSASSHARD